MKIKPRYLDEFVRAYIACALWSSTDDNDEPLDRRFDDGAFTKKALRQMRAECRDFIQANRELLDACDAGRNGWSDAAQHGHDFWLTRNHHGAGFWDRGYGEPGRKLSDAAQVYGECYIYTHRNRLYIG